MVQKMRDLIFASSRGNYLDTYLNHLHPEPETIGIYAKSGAKLVDLQNEAYAQIISSDDPTNLHIYFIAGLCDITRRDVDIEYHWRYRRGFIQHYEEVTMMEGYMQCATRMCDLIDHISSHVLFLGAKPCFASIPPASLFTYNYTSMKNRRTKYLLHSQEYEDMQYMLTNAIMMVNKHISKVNGQNYMATPDLAGSMVELRKKSAPRIHFNRLWDGVHPTDVTRTKWARKLNHAMHMNRRLGEPIDLDEPVPSASDMEDAF